MTELSPSDRATAQAELVSLADLTTPYVLRAAVGLGLPTLAKKGITTIEELAKRSGAPVRTVRSLVAYLTLKGVFVRSSGDNVELSAVGELLTTDQARIMLDPREVGSHLGLALSGLPPAARSGAAGYDAVAGRSFWQALDQDDALAASFDRYMAGWAAQWIPDVLAAYDWSKVARVVDVGGGDGRLLLALLSSYPELRGTLVELERAAKRGRDAFAGKGFADRSNVVVGSFFDPLPAGADLYILAQVIHDWPDDEAIRILRRCADAARPNGRVLLVERLVEPLPSLQHMRADLLMLALFGSGERSRPEFTRLADAAGLHLINTRTIGHDLSLIECVPCP
ncbi:MAG: methyltransferase [Proteobacteria bacterium]|nr:methyltransferase [Pseudomonadota bacterium]